MILEIKNNIKRYLNQRKAIKNFNLCKQEMIDNFLITANDETLSQYIVNKLIIDILNNEDKGYILLENSISIITSTFEYEETKTLVQFRFQYNVIKNDLKEIKDCDMIFSLYYYQVDNIYQNNQFQQMGYAGMFGTKKEIIEKYKATKEKIKLEKLLDKADNNPKLKLITKI